MVTLTGSEFGEIVLSTMNNFEELNEDTTIEEFADYLIRNSDKITLKIE